MSLELWFAFTVASTVILMIPGPTVMVVVGYALAQGKTSARTTVPGVLLGDFIAMTTSVLGAGALLAASATLFTVLKVAGAGYLIWLGIRLWRSDAAVPPVSVMAKRGGNWKVFWNVCLITTLNPKSAIFFIAFLPQFVDPSQPVFMQFVILEATFLILAALNAYFFAAVTGSARDNYLRPAILRRVNRVGAGFLIGAGFLTLLSRRIN